MKQHQTPEFQVIRQNEANAKFFVASFNVPGVTTTPPSVSQYVTGSTSNWF